MHLCGRRHHHRCHWYHLHSKGSYSPATQRRHVYNEACGVRQPLICSRHSSVSFDLCENSRNGHWQHYQGRPSLMVPSLSTVVIANVNPLQDNVFCCLWTISSTTLASSGGVLRDEWHQLTSRCFLVLDNRMAREREPWSRNDATETTMPFP